MKPLLIHFRVLLLTIACMVGCATPSQPAVDSQAHSDDVTRWTKLAKAGQREQVLNETSLALQKSMTEEQRKDVLFVRALAEVPQGDAQAATPAIESFISSAPTDERGGELLYRLAKAQPDPEQKVQTYRQVTDRFAASSWGPLAQGAIRQTQSIGKPFELDFTDALTGQPVSVQRDMKGKVVVIDFWATWCSDCLAEMPALKQLYARYHPQGVEFVGVSLDEPESLGGREKLLNYCTKNTIKWPQYYQEMKWKSAFSSSWGINATPTVFVVDQKGNLHSTNAGKNLEAVIVELLSKQR